MRILSFLLQVIMAGFVLISATFYNNNKMIHSKNNLTAETDVYNYENQEDIYEDTNEENILLSWVEIPDKTNKKEISINFLSKVNKHINGDKNISYIFSCFRDKSHVPEEEIRVLYKGREIFGHDGKYIITKEDEIKENKEYSFQVIFKNEGIYDVELYAEENVY